MASSPFSRLAAKRLIPALTRPTSATPAALSSKFKYNALRSISTAGSLKAAAEYQKTTITEDAKTSGAYEYGFASTMKPRELTSGCLVSLMGGCGGVRGSIEWKIYLQAWMSTLIIPGGYRCVVGK